MPRKPAPDRRARAERERPSTSFPGLLQMRPEGCELPGPQRISLRQPRLELAHRFSLQAIDADPGVELVAVFLDEAAPAQRPQMAAHGRKGNACRLREIPSAVGPLAEEVNNAPAMRVGERRERAVEALSTHRSRSNLKPLDCSISSLETSRTGCEKVQ